MNLVSKILFSIIVLLIGLFGLSKLYDFALQQNCNVKAAYVQKAHIDVDVLIHGPCEPFWMISPAILDKITGLKSYNLALSHSDFADNYLHLYFYLKHNKAPKYLFYYVTPESMDPNYNIFNTFQFAAYIGDPVVDSVVKECDPAYFKWVKIPFMKYAYYSSKINFEVLQGLKHYITGLTTPHFADGYEPPFEVKWDNHLEKFIKLYPEGYCFKWDPLREKYFRKIMELAKSKGTEVYLFESPVLKEAIKYQPNRNAIIKKIRSLADEYKVNFIQFENMKIAESREYYMSALNTNLKGSCIFTDSLGKFIYKLDHKY